MKRILIDITEPLKENLKDNHYFFIKIIAIEETTEDSKLKKQAEFFFQAIDPKEWPKLLTRQQLTHILIVKDKPHGGIWVYYSQSSLIIDVLFTHVLNQQFYSYIQEFLEKDLLMSIILKDYEKYLTNNGDKLQDILKNFPVYNNHNYIHAIEYPKSKSLKNKDFSTLIRVRFEIDLNFLDKNGEK